ncbi:ATP-binding protein [Euzebya sp.]|uniref:sensor histidine kinase n=1 Tax=Euzebya sp. TaxID=1971409 RepID=UPI0035194E1C
MPTTLDLSGTIAVGDLAARRITALARVVLAFGLVALASVDAVDLPSWFVWAAGLVWLPATSLLWFAEEGPPSQVRSLVAIGLDLVVLTTVMWIAPAHATTALLLLVALAGAVTYQGGVRLGATMGAVALGARWLAGAAHPDASFDAAQEGAIVVVAIAVVLLLQRALNVQRRDARSVRAFADASETIIARSTEGIVLTDLDGVVRHANPAAERVLADADGRPLVGAGCEERLALRTHSGQPLDCRTGCALAALCVDDEAVEVRRQVGGESQPLLASATAITGPNGQTAHLHSFRDITRLKQAEEAKTMFLATASHELKTPLTVIRGYAQLLRATTDERAAEALDVIDARSAQLSAIIDRLLLSSRIDAGRVELSTTTHDVSALLRDRVAEVQATFGRAVRADVAEGLHARISADAFITVLDHLVDNAVKYSPDGPPVVVRADAVEGRVLVSVADEGVGMTPEQVAHCFEKFWQAESTDVRRFGGTGIGLYIVRSLVEAMGGQVTIDSTLGVGTTVTVALVAAASPDVSRPPDSSGRHGDRVVPRGSVDEFMQQLGLTSGTGT